MCIKIEIYLVRMFGTICAGCVHVSHIALAPPSWLFSTICASAQMRTKPQKTSASKHRARGHQISNIAIIILLLKDADFEEGKSASGKCY